MPYLNIKDKKTRKLINNNESLLNKMNQNKDRPKWMAAFKAQQIIKNIVRNDD